MSFFLRMFLDVGLLPGEGLFLLLSGLLVDLVIACLGVSEDVSDGVLFGVAADADGEPCYGGFKA